MMLMLICDKDDDTSDSERDDGVGFTDDDYPSHCSHQLQPVRAVDSESE